MAAVRQTSDVEKLDVWTVFQKMEASLSNRAAHHLLSPRGGLHVAVVARLVTVQPNIHLQYLCSSPLEGW
ncbi:hypothetical protein MAR_010279 [Mya arenaria]|uniref:Uncharacterized protein n=1 Tax=Mya arenaria TaxID=6604 RepID=A0ABY7E5A0_MYAAR|nr:hypothetical protein MAR_010279 [Mya arenaria]